MKLEVSIGEGVDQSSPATTYIPVVYVRGNDPNKVVQAYLAVRKALVPQNIVKERSKK